MCVRSVFSFLCMFCFLCVRKREREKRRKRKGREKGGNKKKKEDKKNETKKEKREKKRREKKREKKLYFYNFIKNIIFFKFFDKNSI